MIFTYGLTNSGKTYTVIGEPENPGILPNALKNINDYIEQYYKQETKPQLYCNYIEIYNEEVYDLLANEGKNEKGKKKVQIKEKEKKFYVQSKF